MMKATILAYIRRASQTPLWFRGAIALGLVLRLYLCVFTEGTYDVAIWQGHAEKVAELGLIRYYHQSELANHPPFMSEAAFAMLSMSRHTGIPFRVLLRMPFLVLDAGTCALLLLVLARQPRRYVLASAYWLSPLAILLSSYHGNTDSSVAFFVLLCAWLLSRKATLAAGMAIGVGFWIKLPVVLAIPALLLMVDGWRGRLRFGFVAAATAVATYLPALISDPRIVVANVFGYHGQLIQNTAGIPAWGWYRVLLPFVASPSWLNDPGRLVELLINQGWRIALLLILILVWRRRARRSLPEVCATIAAGYVLVYGLTEFWSFQYFAWSIPFWCFLPSWFFIGATVLAGGYIYALYAYLCGNPWLLGPWDFVGRPIWPVAVFALRDLSVLFFFVSAVWFLVRPVAGLPAPEASGSAPPSGGGSPGSPGSKRRRV